MGETILTPNGPIASTICQPKTKTPSSLLSHSLHSSKHQERRKKALQIQSSIANLELKLQQEKGRSLGEEKGKKKVVIKERVKGDLRAFTRFKESPELSPEFVKVHRSWPEFNREG
ncbi:unnamed protein product [Cuscuta epithymum]|uniref:Uncharacterized protein n=1 Tax=Cuscuta epithymum TaxID=186058 RepID=A0AAV0CMB8_9ASTE|nr:unnamed protein product [Cuscuta epithymum]CAH9144753.1 unnamed protein product [Cuscuta epithymum]